MLKYKHILLATDLSDQTDKIAKVALTFTKGSKAKLSVIHVLEHTPIVYGGGEYAVPVDLNLEEKLMESGRRALAILADRLSIPPSNQYIAHGSIKREILELAEKLDVDLIIIGSHGYHGFHALLGSTANAILHGAKCDVLAVRV